MAKGRSEDRRRDDDGRFGEPCKARLSELIAFAQVYRNWSMGELAAFLGRDVHNLIPGSGVPKADLIYRLARALDWPPPAVFSQVCGDSAAPIEHERGGVDDYRELNRAAFAAFTEGRYEEMISLALRMQGVARTPEQRAEAALRECGGWEGLGRYEQALEAIQRGLREAHAPLGVRMRLRFDLARVYLVLGRWLDAEGIASLVLSQVTDEAARMAEIVGSTAMAFDVRGQARRWRAMAEPDEQLALAAGARQDLTMAQTAWSQYAEQTGVSTYAAAAHTCRGAAMSNEVVLGSLPPERCIEQIMEELDAAIDVAVLPAGAWRESYGWWCVFGCEVAVWSNLTVRDAERVVGVLSAKGLELADAARNWAIRERLLTIEYLRRSNTSGLHTDAGQHTLDTEDVQLIAGVMARFPAFRPFGWELMRRAPRVD
ncbi:MAG: hypothetical protein U0575_03500 [Phycisphaerales bacterium]